MRKICKFGLALALALVMTLGLTGTARAMDHSFDVNLGSITIEEGSNGSGY